MAYRGSTHTGTRRGTAIFFFPKSWNDPTDAKLRGLRRDGKNLVELMRKKGWSYASTGQELATMDPQDSKKVLGLFNYDHLSYEETRKQQPTSEPSLRDMVRFAIRKLSRNREGFMLMVEGGRIDHAAHRNNVPAALGEVIGLDHAVQAAFEMTSSEDTLIVMTSDHETGGLALSGYLAIEDAHGANLFKLKLDFLGSKKRSFFTWATGPGPNQSQFGKNHSSGTTFFESDAAHTAVDVLVLARGPGQEKFSGFMNNIDLPFKIAALMGTAFTSKVNLSNHRAK